MTNYIPEEIENAIVCLDEMADDMTAEISARYNEEMLKWPAMVRKKDRDLQPVIRARQAAFALREKWRPTGLKLRCEEGSGAAS